MTHAQESAIILLRDAATAMAEALRAADEAKGDWRALIDTALDSYENAQLYAARHYPELKELS